MGINHKGRPRFKPGKAAAAAVPAKKSFNETRRMFAVVDGQVRVAPEGDTRYHRSWFRDEGWLSGPDRDRTFEDIPRGFSDSRGLFVYKGSDFNHFVYHDLDPDIVESLKGSLGLDDRSKVWFGAVPSADDGLDGRVYAGTIGQLQEQLVDRASRTASAP